MAFFSFFAPLSLFGNLDSRYLYILFVKLNNESVYFELECTFALPISVFLINILSGTKERKSFILRDLESASHQLLSILLFLDKMEASDWSVMNDFWPLIGR